MSSPEDAAEVGAPEADSKEEERQAGADAEAVVSGSADMPWSDAAYIIGSGACMGTADVVPGVSGGTMAVALGIYQRLLGAITSINGDVIKALLRFRLKEVLQAVHWRFIACLGLGIVVAFVVMVKIVKLPLLLQNYPKQVYAVFFGLVLASAVVLARKLPGWGPAKVGSLLLGAAIGWAVVNLVPVSTPENPLFIFLCGFIAISAMLLPGISGSFILLILGKYAFIMNALTVPKQWPTVALPFALGCLAGLAAFSRLLKWLLSRWHDTIVAGLVGLLIGSLWRIWPYQHQRTIIVREKPRVIESTPFFPDSLEVSVLGLVAAGLVAVALVEVVASRRQAAAR